MIELKEGKVNKIISHRSNLTKVEIELKGDIKQAINYNNLTGKIKAGDRVIVNTSATSLNLGTGGYDFIVYILGQEQSLAPKGHIMKLRYTPYQLQTCSVSEQQSDYHKELSKVDSLANTPVVVGTLHSMLAPITAVIKAKSPQSKVAYIMTDAAALPLALSELVYKLQSLDLIDLTITSGHAFGGQIEAVNIYSALLGSYVKEADIIVVTMGPGIVGTGTKYGFSGTEQAEIINAVSNLAGIPIAVPRINFADSRRRHYGLSHHTRTNLGDLVLVESLLGIPKFKGEQRRVIAQQLVEAKIAKKHKLFYKEQQEIIRILTELEVDLITMGHNYREVPEFFITAGIAGEIAVEQLE